MAKLTLAHCTLYTKTLTLILRLFSNENWHDICIILQIATPCSNINISALITNTDPAMHRILLLLRNMKLHNIMLVGQKENIHNESKMLFDLYFIAISLTFVNS